MCVGVGEPPALLQGFIPRRLGNALQYDSHITHANVHRHTCNTWMAGCPILLRLVCIVQSLLVGSWQQSNSRVQVGGNLSPCPILRVFMRVYNMCVYVLVWSYDFVSMVMKVYSSVVQIVVVASMHVRGVLEEKYN